MSMILLLNGYREINNLKGAKTMIKKYLALLSFPGIGLLIFITGFEMLMKKRTYSFWAKFFAQAFGWVILLYFVPIFLVNILIVPHLPQLGFLGIISAFYFYGAGVLICSKLITLRNNNAER